MRKLLALAGVGAALVLTGFSGAGGRTHPTPPPRAPRHISLLIGVGNYQHAATPKWRSMQLLNLKGPRHDVGLMRTVLRGRGFSAGLEQRVLVDARATKAGIREAFRWLASRATDPGDVVVIYYSGHGSWAPDRNIDAIRTRDEATPADTGDRWDEALVPWDAVDPANPEHLVLDDEIGAWLDRLGTRNVTVIVDACFSGTVTRGSPDATSSSAPVARGPLPPPYASLSSSLLEGGRRMGHTLLTAAASNQKAFEKPFPGGIMAGIFTRALAETLEGAGPNMGLDELMQQVRIRVGDGQTPQLEGDRGGRIFRVGSGFVVPARGYALVRAAGAQRVAMDVGAIHGVRKGALYDVYPAGETRFSAGRLAQVRVDSVFEASSFARIISRTRAVPASARATLSRVPPGVMALDRLRLFVHPSANALRDSLARIPWISLSPTPTGAELRRRGDAYQVLVGGHAVAPLWGDVAGGRSVRATAGTEGGFRGTPGVLCLPLRRAFAITAMNLIQNEQPPPPERLTLDVRLFPDSVTRPVRGTSTVDTAYVGERYNIWAWVEVPRASRQTSKLYFSVGVAGYSDTASVIWPRGNQGLTILTEEQLSRPFVVARFPDPESPLGIESIKAVVSSDRYDLRPLVRNLPSCTGIRPDAFRDGLGTDTLAVTGWTAVHRRVELHPRR